MKKPKRFLTPPTSEDSNSSDDCSTSEYSSDEEESIPFQDDVKDPDWNPEVVLEVRE